MGAPAYKILHTLASKLGLSDSEYRHHLKQETGKSSSKLLSGQEVNQVKRLFNKMLYRGPVENIPGHITTSQYNTIFALALKAGYEIQSERFRKLISKTTNRKSFLNALNPADASKMISALHGILDWKNSKNERIKHD